MGKKQIYDFGAKEWNHKISEFFLVFTIFNMSTICAIILSGLEY